MLDLSEFVGFVTRKSGLQKGSLIEKDILLHRVLTEIFSSRLFNSYLFKGGSCLVKCYLGYYRFSIDLDLTWANQRAWEDLGKNKLRPELINETKYFGSFLELVARNMKMDFRCDLRDKKYIAFGSGNRMVSYKLWKNYEIMKIQVNFVEGLVFNQRKQTEHVLIDKDMISKEEMTYFKDFLKFYRPVDVLAYCKEEILCEKEERFLQDLSRNSEIFTIFSYLKNMEQQ